MLVITGRTHSRACLTYPGRPRTPSQINIFPKESNQLPKVFSNILEETFKVMCPPLESQSYSRGEQWRMTANASPWRQGRVCSLTQTPRDGMGRTSSSSGLLPYTSCHGGKVRRCCKDGGFYMITMTLRQKIRNCGQCQKEKTHGWLSMVANVCGHST